ncbi:MAG TPA: nucleotidyltransferase domain-containing protein [Chloroflexia bacterium]|nr:nucleotidyltransferase domain-containing protein [Chloroflexia bacterium]
MDQALALAHEIALRLGQIDGVAAVALGGSRARGAAKPNSDIDLGLYYDPTHPPALAELRKLAQEVDDEHRAELVTDFGGWGRWINGGGWLKVNGIPVDWLYRNLAEVRQTLEECRAGVITSDLNAGHPHAFHNYIYLGETHFCQPLYDPQNLLAELKALAETYPPLLKRAIINSFLWQAQFALDISRKSVARAESYYVAGCFFRCVVSLVQVLFALNEQFYMNEKGAVSLIESFELHPANFERTVSAVMAHPGETAALLQANLERLEQLVAQTRQLVESYGD